MALKAHKVNRSLGGTITLFLFLGILGIFMMVPLLFVTVNAFKPLNELFIFPPKLYVIHPTFNNFRQLFQIMNGAWMPFSRYLFNTLMITTVGTAGHIIVASLCAYSLSKLTFPGSKAIFRVIVLSLMFTPAVTTVPTYIIMAKIGLVDSLWAIILPALQSSLGLYLMKQFLDTGPDSLLEAGRIDGTNELYLFVRIVMPVIRPAWLTLSILSIQGLWNTVSPYTYSEHLKTVPQALSQIVSAGIARSGVGSAVALLIILVPIVCFVISQASIIQTMSTSGMKG